MRSLLFFAKLASSKKLTVFYKYFVFIVGTHDKTGGLLAGADMVIDNIVAEEPYTISTGAVGDLLKAIHFENNANAANPRVKV